MQPETLFETGFILITSAVLATVAAGCVFWIRWFKGWGKRNLCGDRSPDLVTRLPQPMPRWTVFDFFIMFGLMIMVGSLMQESAKQNAEPTPVAVVMESQADGDQATEPETGGDSSGQVVTLAEETPEAKVATLVNQVRIHFIANLVAFLCTLVYLRFVHGATLSHLSLIPTKSDLRRGVVATVWILAPVLIINLVIANLVKYEHTVTDLLAQQNGVRTFAFLLFSAAFLTPIIEEFQFRLLLQGGLQRLADAAPTETIQSPWHPTSNWPVYVTSLIFAAMHLGQGAAPIPLFFLSVGLGFLYQRTGRLVPAIVVHMLLNGATLCMEFCRVNAM